MIRLYEKTVDRRELDKLLSEKANKTSVVASFARMENVLAEQEKVITTTRLKVNDVIASGGPARDGGSVFVPLDRSSTKPLSQKENIYDENFTDARMKEGREQVQPRQPTYALHNHLTCRRLVKAIMDTMWQKLSQLAREIQRVRSEGKGSVRFRFPKDAL